MKVSKEIVLKNGTMAQIKSPSAEDAEGVCSVIRKTSGETPFMLRYPDEFKMSAEEEASYLEKVAASKDSIMISVFIDGKIVGNCGVSPVAGVEKCKHRAEVGLAILKEYWGLGIGTALLQEARIAAREAGYEQMELEVVTANERAVSIYKKLGFISYGIRPYSFRCRDGSYQDLNLMYCRL